MQLPADVAVMAELASQHKIQRHKAAIRRSELSLPIKCLMRDQLLDVHNSVFDYGCGYGEDVQQLRKLGFESDGWDPAYCNQVEKTQADVVNLGYVLNVIEDVAERGETLLDAWLLCRKVMSVAARILVGGRGNSEIEYGDGILTSIGTFQKFFAQAELREYIESILKTEAIPAAPGVFYVFRDEELRQQFLASRYRRRSATPRKRASERRFEENREVLEPLMEWVAQRGRLPELDEFGEAGPILEEFGSLKRAFALIRRVTGADDWETIREKRTEDVLVYLALANFRNRPRLSKLPLEIQRDIRAFFGTYKRACQEADELLYQVGDPDIINEACKNSPIGKLLPNALYVHRSALDYLEPLLRIYEGCTRAYLGEIDGANLIKIHRYSGKLSYLVYPDFDSDPHPALLRSVKLSMRTLDLNCYDYSNSDNPPILHRKETFLRTDHPLYEKFARLTRQEEKHGLLDSSSSIGTRSHWQQQVEASGFQFRGHRLVRIKS